MRCKEGIEDQSPWQWAKKYRKDPPGMHKLNMHTDPGQEEEQKTTKYQFGVKVPISTKEAHELDKLKQGYLMGQKLLTKK